MSLVAVRVLSHWGSPRSRFCSSTNSGSPKVRVRSVLRDRVLPIEVTLSSAYSSSTTSASEVHPPQPEREVVGRELVTPGAVLVVEGFLRLTHWREVTIVRGTEGRRRWVGRLERVRVGLTRGRDGRFDVVARLVMIERV